MLKRPLLVLPTIGLLVAIATPAHAILGVGDLVSDPPVEINTAAIEVALGIADTSLAAIQASDALTATSVTTPGDPGLYQGVNGFLDAQDSLLTSAGVSSATMQAIFPGWMSLLPDNISANAAITQTGLGTYEAAVQIAQNQAADFDAESTYFASIESANVGSTSLLGATQINTEAAMAVAAQVQMERQLIVALITVEAFRSADELNERAQAGATTAQAANMGVPPQ
jgi:hypothetical protein